MKRLGFFSTVALLSLAVAVAGCSNSAKKICIPQDIECEGDDVVICNAEGTEWTLSEACDDSCVDGICVIDCTPDCDGKDCGDDGCGGSCGTCPGALDECIEGACVCQLDCTGKVCGDDGCEGSCGTCPGALDECIEGACVCQLDCTEKDCGDDGCGGSCGTCEIENTYCSAEQLCLPCETAVCGVCDEIDISTIVAYSGAIGGDHAIDQLRAECFTDWPITTDLEVTFDGTSAGFILHHFDGESWRNTIAENFTDGAVMVACWDSIAHGGIFCQSWEWYTPDVGGIYRHFDWPADRPVAHVLISAIDDKRTAIKYFDSWPFNNLGTGFDGTDVSTNLPRRSCQ